MSGTRRTEWLCIGHPAWPDPLQAHTVDRAREWYAEHVGTQPQIRVVQIESIRTDITTSLADQIDPDTPTPTPAETVCTYTFPLPSWAGEDQMEPCRCDLPAGHPPTDHPSGHSCSHLRGGPCD